MLVLTRKSEQKIVIGDKENRIVIHVLKIQGDKVSLGIEADRDTPIFRYELTLREKPQQMDLSSPLQKIQIDLNSDTQLEQDEEEMELEREVMSGKGPAL